jgi:HPt (histidine-containing phosphotransfer) domain-containing protein
MQAAAAIEPAGGGAHKRALRPIDLVHLAKQCLGDANLEREVLRLFETTIRTYAGRLARATSIDEQVAVLHSIKGASAGVGAFTVADLAKAGEAVVREGRPLEGEQIADLNVAIEEASAFIARVVGQD